MYLDDLIKLTALSIKWLLSLNDLDGIKKQKKQHDLWQNENIKKTESEYLKCFGLHYEYFLIQLLHFFSELIQWLLVEIMLLEQVNEIPIKFLIKQKQKHKNLCEKLLLSLHLKLPLG
jgi:hypothetical protein